MVTVLHFFFEEVLGVIPYCPPSLTMITGGSTSRINGKSVVRPSGAQVH